ncbi:MAG: LCP family protein, partial [Syntrophomonadaceae bacterium]|nr:LCP family protein [Syntrophomonadaceae bacterium]
MGKFKIKGTTAAAALFIFFITFGLGLWAGSLFKAGGISEVLKINPGKSYNILVMGIDAQKGEKNSRSDTMILVSMDKKSKKTVMVWIPRDTRV